jgi:hypothetical protein
MFCGKEVSDSDEKRLLPEIKILLEINPHGRFFD